MRKGKEFAADLASNGKTGTEIKSSIQHAYIAKALHLTTINCIMNKIKTKKMTDDQRSFKSRKKIKLLLSSPPTLPPSPKMPAALLLN